MGQGKRTYHRKRKANTFAYLWHANTIIFEGIEKKHRGYGCLTSLILSAFSFEAYLNHLGLKLVKYWSKIERISWKNKLCILSEILKLMIDFKKPPWHDIDRLMQFRNQIAHGRSATLEDTVETDIELEMWEYPLLEWEKFNTEENARTCYKSVLEAMKKLNVAAGFDEYPETDFGLSSRYTSQATKKRIII